MQGILTSPEQTEAPAMLPGHALLPYQEMLDPDGGVLLLETPRQQQSFWHRPTLSLGCAWQVTPRNMEPLDIGACLALARQHEHMAQSLPVGAALQTLTTILPARQVPAWEKRRADQPEDALLQAQRDALRSGLKHKEPGGSGQLRAISTLLTLRLPLTGIEPSLVAKLRAVLAHGARAGDSFTARLEPLIHDQLRDFETARLGVDDTLRAAGHQARRLDGEGLKQAIAQALAPDQHEAAAVLTAETPIKTQVLTRPMHQAMVGGFVFGTAEQGISSQMVSLHHAPPRTYPGMLCATRAPDGVEPLAVWQSWDGPITIAVNIAVTEPTTEEAGRKVKRWFAERNQDSSTENQAVVKELKTLETQFFTGGGHLHWGRVHIALWGAAEALPAGLAALKRRATQVHLPLEVETGPIGSTLWLQTLPLNFDPTWPSRMALQRGEDLPLTALVNLCTLYGCWQGMDDATTILLLGARGEPVLIDVFKHRVNPHVAVAGTSGAGKTYLLTEIVEQVMALHGATGLLIDPLSNFRNICACLDGTVLHLTYENPPCINPFYGSLTEQHQAFITTFLAECASRGRDVLSAEEFSVMGSAVSYLAYGWDQPGVEPTLTYFVEGVLKDGRFALNDTEARRIGETLARKLLLYYGGRQYARFVDGVNTFSLTPGLTLIELSEFEEAPALQGIIFFALAHLARQLFRDRTRFYMPKYFWADEVWKWLALEETAKMVEQIIRTYRNFNTSAWFVSQRLSDFDSPVGRIVLDLTETKFFLQHSTSEYAAVKTLFQLTDAEMVLVSQAKKHADWSSGFLRLGAGEGGLVRLVSNPFSRLLRTQEPTLAKRREQLIEQYGGKVRPAIAQMMAEGLAV